MYNIIEECTLFCRKHERLETTVCSIIIDFYELMKHILCQEFNLDEQEAKKIINDIGGERWFHFKFEDLMNGDDLKEYEPSKEMLEYEVICLRRRLCWEIEFYSIGEKTIWLWDDIVRLNEVYARLKSFAPVTIQT